MPSRRDENGIFRDIAHPITTGARHLLEESILAAYHEHITNQQAHEHEPAEIEGNP